MTKGKVQCGRVPAIIGLIGALLLSSCSAVGSNVAREAIVSTDAILKEQTVMKQMLIVQTAAEDYGAEHGGKFPTQIDDAFKGYLPKGGGVENPFAGTRQMPELGNIEDLDALSKGRPPAVKSGVVQYNTFEDGKVYAIVGGGATNEAVRDPDNYDRTFILSNIKKYSSDAEFLKDD
jgi:hypothetical protein